VRGLTHLRPLTYFALLLPAKTLRFCYDRLSSLLKTLEISAVDDFTPIHLVADFATLLGTYQQGFAVSRVDTMLQRHSLRPIRSWAGDVLLNTNASSSIFRPALSTLSWTCADHYGAVR
jgi:hypothetical protein